MSKSELKPMKLPKGIKTELAEIQMLLEEYYDFTNTTKLNSFIINNFYRELERIKEKHGEKKAMEYVKGVLADNYVDLVEKGIIENDQGMGEVIE